MFRQSPGFLFAAASALALGIGANTAIFSVINSVVLKPLTYPDPDHLVQFFTTYRAQKNPNVSVPEFQVWTERADLFQDVSAYDHTGPALNLTGGAFPEQIIGKHVTKDFFRLFGAPVVLGRTFTDEEDRPNGGFQLILSESLWRRRFGGDPQILGKRITLGSQS